MRLFEIFEHGVPTVSGAGWLNLRDFRWVPVPHGMPHSHASQVALQPKQFGLDPEDLLEQPDLPDCLASLWSRPDWRRHRPGDRRIIHLDGDPDLMSFMSQRGWTRVIHRSPLNPHETNIQAEHISEVKRAAVWIYDNAGGIDRLYFDIGGDADSGLTLTGGKLMRFLAGRYQPRMVSREPEAGSTI